MAKYLSFLCHIAALAGTIAFTQISLQADIKLPSVFGNHMVLQQGQKLPIWGWAAPGESVTVSVAGQSKSTKADNNGSWEIHLSPISSSKTPVAFSVKGANNSIEYLSLIHI